MSGQEQEPRMDRVEEVRWRIRTNYYGLEDVVEETVERLLLVFKNTK